MPQHKYFTHLFLEIRLTRFFGISEDYSKNYYSSKYYLLLLYGIEIMAVYINAFSKNDLSSSEMALEYMHMIFDDKIEFRVLMNTEDDFFLYARLFSRTL